MPKNILPIRPFVQGKKFLGEWYQKASYKQQSRQHTIVYEFNLFIFYIMIYLQETSTCRLEFIQASMALYVSNVFIDVRQNVLLDISTIITIPSTCLLVHIRTYLSDIPFVQTGEYIYCILLFQHTSRVCGQEVIYTLHTKNETG